LIVTKRELELLGYIIREAERYESQCAPALLDGRLSGFFPASLEADAEMASWMWINDPEGAVTLDGYSYYGRSPYPEAQEILRTSLRVQFRFSDGFVDSLPGVHGRLS